MDLDAGGAELEALAAVLDLPPTLTAVTPSGGRHYLYALPDGATARRVIHPDGQPFDILGNGYAVLPTSPGRTWIDPEAPIAIGPAWVREALSPPPDPAPEPRHPALPADPTRAEAYVGAVIDAEAERVAILAPGSRNVELHRSASRVGRVIDLAPNLESEAVAALEGAARANGLIHDDGPHAVATAIAGGLRWGREHPRELPSEGRHAPAVDLDAPDPSDVRTTARATLAHLPAIVASLDLHPGRRPTVFRVLREFLETVAETGCPVVVENLRETARDADVAVGSIVAKRFIDHETGETRERQALAADLGPLGWRWQPGLPDDGTGRARASRWSWAPPGGFTELGERAP